jgi:hypothetical protein
VHCQSGVCPAIHLDTIHGTFSHYAPGDSAGKITLLMQTVPSPDPPAGAVLRGRRLELYGFWIYEGL